MTVITEELRDMLGVDQEPHVFEVEAGHIQRFVEAVGDTNPLWTDKEFAATTHYGAPVAPPTFLVDYGLIEVGDKLMGMECSLSRFVNGGTEIEIYKPMKVGDTITTVARIADLIEKEGKQGTLLLIIIEVVYTNQRGELVKKCRETFIRY